MSDVSRYDDGSGDLGAFEALVGRRRTSLILDSERPVPLELVTRLVDLIAWAPNHKRTWPWQVAWITGDGRGRLGDVAADAMAARGDEPPKVAKTRTKYLRAPGMLVVGSVTGDSELRTAENRDAAAAGVQNLLLGATAAGLASFWSSCPKGAEEPVASFCGFPPGTAIVALVYLGWPTGIVETPARPSLELRHVDG